jgi:hypothetical protein
MLRACEAADTRRRENWTTITIPRGTSAGFNQRVWGKSHYQMPTQEKE